MIYTSKSCPFCKYGFALKTQLDGYFACAHFGMLASPIGNFRGIPFFIINTVDCQKVKRFSNFSRMLVFSRQHSLLSSLSSPNGYQLPVLAFRRRHALYSIFKVWCALLCVVRHRLHGAQIFVMKNVCPQPPGMGARSSRARASSGSGCRARSSWTEGARLWSSPLQQRLPGSP